MCNFTTFENMLKLTLSILLLVFGFIFQAKAEEPKRKEVKSYVGFKPIGLITGNPNIQFGFRSYRYDSIKKPSNQFLEIGLCYPYTKTLIKNDNYLYSSGKISPFFLAIQADISYRFLSKRNKYWAPLFESEYVTSTHKFPNNFPVYRSRYLFLKLGFLNGKYYFKDSKKTFHSINWGAAFRYKVLLNNFYGYPNSPMAQYVFYEFEDYSFKIYVTWQFGKVKR